MPWPRRLAEQGALTQASQGCVSLLSVRLPHHPWRPGVRICWGTYPPIHLPIHPHTHPPSSPPPHVHSFTHPFKNPPVTPHPPSTPYPSSHHPSTRQSPSNHRPPVHQSTVYPSPIHPVMRLLSTNPAIHPPTHPLSFHLSSKQLASWFCLPGL